MRWHRPLLVLAAAMAVLTVISAGGLLFDDRMLLGQPIWLKPLKFSISFMLYALTLAWMLSFVGRGRRLAHVAGTFIAVSGFAEVALIAWQAARGTRSHFNVATDYDNNIWIAMGATIGVLYVATLVVAVVLFWTKIADRTSQWSIRLGVVLAMFGMGVGGLMLRATPSQQAQIDADMETVVGAHSVGVDDGGPAMPFTGWSTTGGDLRVGHFVGMHALQLLPLLAIVLTGLARRPRFAALLVPARNLRLVVLAAGLYAGLIALVTWQALRGQPLTHPDTTTVVAAGLLVVLAVGGVSIALKRPVPEGPSTRPVAVPQAR
jgi:hypothetical protein